MPNHPCRASSRADRQARAIAASGVTKPYKRSPPSSTAHPPAVLTTSYLRVSRAGFVDMSGSHLVLGPPAATGYVQFTAPAVQTALHVIARPAQQVVDGIAARLGDLLGCLHDQHAAGPRAG